MSVPAVTLRGMERELPYTLRNLARLQSGVVSRMQAIRSGLTPDMINFRVSSGRWRPVHRGVYATFSGVPGRNARLWAAFLWAGRGAVLSHETAAELHGLTDKLGHPIHVTVPAQRRVAAADGVVLHRSVRAIQVVRTYPYPPATRINDTVLDLTQAAATFDDACGWVTRA